MKLWNALFVRPKLNRVQSGIINHDGAFGSNQGYALHLLAHPPLTSHHRFKSTMILKLNNRGSPRTHPFRLDHCSQYRWNLKNTFQMEVGQKLCREGVRWQGHISVQSINSSWSYGSSRPNDSCQDLFVSMLVGYLTWPIDRTSTASSPAAARYLDLIKINESAF